MTMMVHVTPFDHPAGATPVAINVNHVIMVEDSSFIPEPEKKTEKASAPANPSVAASAAPVALSPVVLAPTTAPAKTVRTKITFINGSFLEVKEDQVTAVSMMG